MDRFECYGHRLDLQRLNNDIVALCQCGKWRKIMPLSDERELKLLVSQLMGEHYRHVDSLGRPSAMDARGAGSPVLPDRPASASTCCDRLTHETSQRGTSP